MRCCTPDEQDCIAAVIAHNARLCADHRRSRDSRWGERASDQYEVFRIGLPHRPYCPFQGGLGGSFR